MMVKIDKANKFWDEFCTKKNNRNTVVIATSGAGKSYPFVQSRVLEAEAHMLAPNEHINEEG